MSISNEPVVRQIKRDGDRLKELVNGDLDATVRLENREVPSYERQVADKVDAALGEMLLGAGVPNAILVTSFDDINRSGFFRANNAPDDAPDDATYLMCLHSEGLDGRAFQLVTRGTHVRGVNSPIWTRRRNSNNEWTEYEELLSGQARNDQIESNAVSNDKLAQRSELVDSFNTIQQTGFYRGGASGSPSEGDPFGILAEVIHLQGASQYATQIGFRQNMATPEVKIRARQSTGEWGEWVDLLRDTGVPTNGGLAPLRGVYDRQNLTSSLEGGDITNRPPLTGLPVFIGGSGPSISIEETPFVIARRQLVDLGPNIEPRRVLSVNAAASRKSGSSVDIEFGVAWYRNTEQPSDTAETIAETFEGIGTGITSVRFTIGRAGSRADIIAPSNAYFAAPFVRFLATDGTPLFIFLDVQDVTLLTTDASVNDSALLELDADIQRRPTFKQSELNGIRRVTEAEAKALSPMERTGQNWWYVTDGDNAGLTYVDDLPTFVPRTFAIDDVYPGGDFLDTSTFVETDPDTVVIRGRQGLSGFNVRYFAARVTGVRGRKPSFRIVRTDLWNSPRGLERHRLVWSTDPDGENWYTFDNQTDSPGENRWYFENDQPFDVDTIYLSNLPNWSYTRYDKMITRWIQNPLTRPTPSGIDGTYQIGTLDAREAVGPGVGGKSIPTTDHYAFAVGNGPLNVTLTSGVHPDEQPGHYIFAGAIEAILSNTPVGHRLRDAFTFYCYPRVNAQGMYAGAQRIQVETGTDCNRIWGDDEQSLDIRSLYETVWNNDTGGSIAAAFDFHSTAARNPLTSTLREFWVQSSTDPDPVQIAFLAALRRYGDTSQVTITSDNTVIWFMRQISDGVGLAAILEATHDANAGSDEWRAYGRDVMRALDQVGVNFN